jgi:hypothetical protein
MVGDGRRGSLTQFRNISTQDPDKCMVSHTLGEHHMFKIEPPVSFQDFYPAVISKDLGGLYVGQGITTVGYGLTKRNGRSVYPGEAYQGQLQVASVEEGYFIAQSRRGGPCNGAFDFQLSSIFHESPAAVTDTSLTQEVGGYHFWTVQWHWWAS